MNYPLLDIFLTMFWFFMWCMWILLVGWTILLIFNNRDLGGWAKAAWVILVIFVPLLGVLAYLIAHGRHVADDQASEYPEPRDEAEESFVRMETRGPHSADELAKLAELHRRGVLTDEEFRKGKLQLLG